MVNGALVRVVDRSTGYESQTFSHDGRFIVSGLRVGGPFSVIVQHPVYSSARYDSIYLTVAEYRRIDIELPLIAVVLDTLHVTGARASRLSASRAGTMTTISDSMLRRMPTSDRNYYEFALLSPHLSGHTIRTGVSASGVSVRFNNFLLDGVSERGLLGNFAAGTGQAGKPIPIEAVQEYQVLISPYDVRYSDFAGAFVNAVTRSGSNEFAGTGFLYVRNETLARSTPLLRAAPYDRRQFGFTVSGPIVRNRAHFFLASEVQHLTTPAPGPYVSGESTSQSAIPVAQLDVSRFASILEAHGITGGSAGRVQIGTPLRNFFGKVAIDWPGLNSRLILFSNYSRVENVVFARGTSVSVLARPSAAFSLSSLAFTNQVDKHVTAAQLYTSLSGTAFNELTVAVKSQPSQATPFERAPLVSVKVPHVNGAGVVFLEAGSNEAAHGVGVEQPSFEVNEHLKLNPHPSHRLGFGARLELFTVRALGQAGAYGSWLFSSLDSLRSGLAERYHVVKIDQDQAHRGYYKQLGLYASDEWQPTDRLSITFGLRADVLRYADRPQYNALVDSVFARRNSEVPAPIHWSPRIGFEWHLGPERRARLRGGLGLFAGRPPLGWLGRPITNHGHGAGVLECGSRRTDSGPTPHFVPDYNQAPQTCANDGGISAGFGGAVNLVDADLRLAAAFKASLSYDHTLPGNLSGTIEALYTRNTSDFVFVNLNLGEPRDVDRRGRVMYGSLDSLGLARRVTVTNRFSEVIEVRNHSRNHSFQAVGRLEKRFSNQLEAMVSYTFSRVRDVQTLPNSFSYSDNWRLGRVMSTRHDALTADVSSNDIPQRLVIAGTWSLPWRRWKTDLSMYYIGEAGTPFTYTAALAPGRGDLNADGTNLNDPIYVPRSAADTAEILFFGSASDIAVQQVAFDEFVEQTGCLRRQRGSIMARNSCRTPRVNVVNASLRQALPEIRGKVVSLHLDIFNVLNLMNRDWGQVHTLRAPPNVALFEHMAQTPGPTNVSQPVFRYDPARPHFDSENAESAYQLQIGVHFRF